MKTKIKSPAKTRQDQLKNCPYLPLFKQKGIATNGFLAYNN
jgi:hypothetical protein